MYVMLRNVTLQNLCGYFIQVQNLLSFALEARYVLPSTSLSY